MFPPTPPSDTRSTIRTEAGVNIKPAIDATERLLLRVFLRRYVTWCARQRRFAAMQGAARLYCEVSAT